MTYQVLGGAKQPIKVWIDDLAKAESQALDQLRAAANLPWVTGVSAMPDLHFGKGAVVGSVIMNDGAVTPSMVGVDIGCGVIAVRTPYKQKRLGSAYALAELRAEIEKAIPVGTEYNTKVTKRVKDAFEDDEIVWVMLHSGSRRIGKELAEIHVRKAKGMLGEVVKSFGENIWIPEEFAPLLVGTPEYQAYLTDLHWCQAYARANRDEMMLRTLTCLSEHLFNEDRGAREMIDFRVDSHHNYIEEVVVDGKHCLLTRKGAVSAKEGEWGIVPGSMGTKSFIVKGKGNPDSFCSCSHGAGRKMSRTAARKKYTKKDLENQTKGVECRKDKDVIDELPSAYKNIDHVMANQTDLVEAVYEIKQVLCVKGA